uniref:Vps41 beta-propeller domain-containing protein n=1 Tax=Strigamia maritima TaxID=126957 RepID=T1JD77_STRMM
METDKAIALIKRDHSSHLRSELYRCNLFWKNNFTLLIGWADTVKVCVIRTSRPEETRDLPVPFVEIVNSFTTQFYVCGIAPYENNLVVLCCNKEEELEIQKSSDYRPQFCVIEPNVDDYSIVCIDMLSIRGYEKYRCNDYQLEYLQEDNTFYIVSPKDIIVAKPRDEDDHVAWLIEHKKFEKAMTAVKENEKLLKKHTLVEVGRSYLDHLLSFGNYEEAATLCVEILDGNKQLWEEEVFKFAQINQLQVIAKYLPYETVKLESTIYEMVLNEFLQHDYQGFHAIIKQWPSQLYKIPNVIEAVLDKLAYEPNSRVLLQALGDLHMFSKNFDKAFNIYLKLGLPESFDLIPDHNLFKLAAQQFDMLMLLDKDKAMKLCLKHIDKIPIDLVVKRLSKKKDLLCYYLDRLFAKDNQLGGQWHGLLVSLYAEYDPTKLLSFLKSSNYYPLQEALEVCRQYSRINEQVFLLGRIGNSKQALQLITDKLNDINGAIEFCKEYDDRELWDDLISYSLDKPEFIKVLLNNIGTHVDPIVFIRRIDDKLEIPGLRDALVNILHDYNLQMSLREGCKRILVSDWFSLQERLNKQQKKGIAVYDDYICHACHQKIIVKDIRQTSNVSIFYCKHMYHENCLPDITTDTCMTCSSQKRGPGSNSVFHSN